MSPRLPLASMDPSLCSCCDPSLNPNLADDDDAEPRSTEAVDSPPQPEIDVARVEFSNEAAALREALAGHQLSVQELYSELEEERGAAASAAAEAMSMILRLQREKAEVQMDSRQFRRFAEEKMAHDQREIEALEDLLFKRDQTLHSLSCEIQSYKHRLASYGILNLAVDPQIPDSPHDFDLPFNEYPPLRCALPTAEDEILKTMPSSSGGHGGVMDKGVVVGHSPRWPKHLRRLSVDSYGSGFGQEFNKVEESPVFVDRSSENGGRDDMSDRVYTIDTVHGLDRVSTPREFGGKRDEGSIEEGEIKKLYLRLQALEADRESMRQAIMLMGTDTAQIVLLKEIAQNMRKEVAPKNKLVKKASFLGIFSVMSAIVWVASIVFWRKKSNRNM